MANRADERKFHYIYKITRVDGKFYIGMHSTDDLDDDFGSGQLLWKSIKKHGKEKHSKEILEFLPSRKDLKTREKEIVTEELLGNAKCLNLRLGGDGGKIQEPGFYSRIGKMAAALVTFEDRVERSKKRVQTQRVNGTLGQSFRGKIHTEKIKRQISATCSVSYQGAGNSQYGTCWVTNGVPIKIKKEQLEEFLSKGYSRGRQTY